MEFDRNLSECFDIRDYFRKVDDYTLRPSTITAFAVIYTFIISFGVIGNLLVVLSVVQHRSLRSVRNIFIVSLSCSDIVVSLVSGIVTPISAFSKIWLFGTVLCYLVPLIQGTSLCFSTLTLTAIAVDRYILIIYPTARPIQKLHASLIVMFNCSLALALAFPMVLNYKLEPYTDERLGEFCGQFCAEDWTQSAIGKSLYGTVVLIIQFGLPLLVITFCYAMIYHKLSRGMLMRKNDDETLMSEQRKNALRRRNRTNKMLMWMVGVFFICWLPSVVFNIIRDYDVMPDFMRRQSYLYGVITHCISVSSTVWNPCLYALMNEQFRVAFYSLMPPCPSKDKKDRGYSSLFMSTILDGRTNTTRIPEASHV